MKEKNKTQGGTLESQRKKLLHLEQVYTTRGKRTTYGSPVGFVWPATVSFSFQNMC
jgi:hypothetical protein